MKKTFLLPFYDKTKVKVNPYFMIDEKLPTYFWKEEDGYIIEMSRPEKLERLRDLRSELIDQKFYKYLYPDFKKRLVWSFGILILAFVFTMFINKHVKIG